MRAQSIGAGLADRSRNSRLRPNAEGSQEMCQRARKSPVQSRFLGEAGYLIVK